MLHLQLLGPLLVQDDEGRDLTPPGARERDGLVTLAIVSPDPLSTERIAAELYRERNASDPRNAVQAMVSRLRRCLGRSAGSIETTTNGYQLVDATLDVDHAEQLLSASIAEPDPATATDLLEQAMELWHGPTLDGLSGELIDAERLRIDGLRADAEDSVLERRLDSGIDQSLVGTLETAVREQPFREKRWELLMLALYREGRQAEALRAFQRARSLLSNHLGLEPGPALSRLEQQILSHDPVLDVALPTGHASIEAAAEVQLGSGPTAGLGESLPRGTLTVLMCDVVGSVRRWEAAPTDTARDIEQLHRTWEAVTDTHGGRLVKSTGDGVLSVFTTAGSAVLAAAEGLRRELDGSLDVKVAVNTGPLQPIEGGDYRGPTVNRCARLLDLAHGSQILVSGTAADLAAVELGTIADRDLAGGLDAERLAVDRATPTLRNLGVHRLRDVPEPIAIWQVEGGDLPSNFPPLDAGSAIPLPRLRNELYGRVALQAEVQERIDDEKLVTLLGPGGIGKTTLAVAAAWEVAGARPLRFVDLARITDPSAVAQRLAEAIVDSDHDDERDPIDRIVDRLRLNTDLVVVDNAEHVLDAVADTVDQVLANEVKASFLVTSRQPLGLADEFIVGVPPLELPSDDDDLSATGRSPSVQLFIERARTIRPDFEVPSGRLPVVAHICRRLDGVPLAIELAAGRASLLSVDDIAAMLDDQ
ncbi:MAG: BTAD domain-containing putative transcriptional regulator, partial [Acidimicrobiales bacterium]